MTATVSAPARRTRRTRRLLTTLASVALASVGYWVAPAEAAQAAPRRGLGPVRTVLGLLAVAGGCALSLVVARQAPDKAVQSAFLVLILFCVAVGLLGPRIIGPAAALASLLLWPFGPAAQAAMLSVRPQTPCATPAHWLLEGEDAAWVVW